KLQSRYPHAKQFNRARRSTRKLKAYLGRVIRDVERKAINPSPEPSELLGVSRRISELKRKSRTRSKTCTSRARSASARAKRISVTSSVARCHWPPPVGAP